MWRSTTASFAALWLWASPAFAAGGSDVIDDSTPETPGHCHLDARGILGTFDVRAIGFAPACTLDAMPKLEIGAAFLRTSSNAGIDPTLGPALKLNLREEETGLGAGLIGQANFNLKSGRMDTAAIVIPVTVPLGKAVTWNTDFGGIYNLAGTHEQGFAGTQIEADIGHDLNLMGEVYGRAPGHGGAQIRLRWTPGGGNFDFDLLYGLYPDGFTAREFTIGVTIRT